jgi:hypothetical protein
MDVKLGYERPELIDLGTLAELTEGTASPAVPDTTFTGNVSTA